jgi:hypothetical protein
MSEETKDKEKTEVGVAFGDGSKIAITGIIGGVILAIGFPTVVLVYGQALGPTFLMIFVLSGLAIGGLVALTAAFFGLVLPRQVGGETGNLNDWIKWGIERKNWSEEDWKKWADCADWTEPDYKNWTLQDWKDWGERVKAKGREMGK